MQFRVMDNFIQLDESKTGGTWRNLAKIEAGHQSYAELLVAQANSFMKVEGVVDEFMSRWIEIQQPVSRKV